MSDNSKEQAQAQYESIESTMKALALDWQIYEAFKEELEDLLKYADEADDTLNQHLEEHGISDSECEDISSLTFVLHIDSEDAHTNLELFDWETYFEMREAAGEWEDYDDAYQAVMEDPLSVEVRSGWQPRGEILESSEYMILLCTGGPAVRIVGDLDKYGEPANARLEHQDWFESWREYRVDSDIIMEYAQQFFGY